MQKVKANARWKELTPENQKTLDKWLFEEKLSYAEILPRAQNELGFKGEASSLKRYYQRRRQERTMEEFTDLRDELADISGAPADVGALRAAAMKLMARFLFDQVKQSPDKVKEWAAVANLIVQNDRNELLRELKSEENTIRREAIALAKEKFEFDATEQALKALPQLQELEEARKDPNTTRYEENIRWNRAKRAVLGFCGLVHPESAQEEAEMLAAKRERDARREEQDRRLREGEEIINAQPPPPSSQYYAEYTAWQARQEAEAQAREKAFRESRAQAAEVSEVEQAKQKESREQQEAERAEPKKPSVPCGAETLERFEELREICGWQAVPRPPGTEEGK